MSTYKLDGKREVPRFADQERYLGDGVYASFDGYRIWLRHEREKGWHTVGLEPRVVSELAKYLDSIHKELKGAVSS